MKIDGSTDRQAPLLMQYNRLSEDVRNLDRISWQVPSVAVAITAGLLGVAYQYLQGAIRVCVLLLGGFFVLSLTIALAKHRLMMDVRSRFLQQIERELQIHEFPVTTEESISYLERLRQQGIETRKSWLLDLLKHKIAGIWLLRVLFTTSIFVFVLALLELGLVLYKLVN